MIRLDPVWSVAGSGAVTAILLALGADTVGSALALVHLGLLVGGPVALLLTDTLRARSAVLVLAVALSLAMSAVAVQSLVWFDLAMAETIVILATVYGVALALLLSSTSPLRSATTTVTRPTGGPGGQRSPVRPPSKEGPERW